VHDGASLPPGGGGLSGQELVDPVVRVVAVIKPFKPKDCVITLENG